MIDRNKWANRYWGERPMPSNKTEFFNSVTIPAATGDDTVATIRIYGPIDSWGGLWGVSAEDVSSVLDALSGSVQQLIIRLNSPGGDVFEALAILNMLRARGIPVLAVVDGIAASAASVIAAGCDETVMSPGTQMMIHSVSTFAYGNAEEMRKNAEILDSLDASLIEVYSAKAGDQDWAALLADETWLTSAAALEIGLIDRIGVVPDAGEAVTATEQDPELVVLPPEAEPEDTTSQAALAYLRSRKPPIAAALGSNTERKEKAVAFSNDQLKTMRSELGLADDADEAAITAAFVARSKQPTIPEGVTLIDSEQLEHLRASAALGAEARDRQVREDRERLIDNAISQGKFAAARRDHFLALHAADPEGTAATIAALEANTIPVAEVGFDAAAETIKQTESDEAYDAFAARMGLKKGA